MTFAKRVFRIAGVWGFVVLMPMYFALDWIGLQYPPAITHSDFYYGFLGLALAWQVGFLVIASDPVRYRAMMVPAMLEKFIYVVTLCSLYAQSRLRAGQLTPAVPDLVLGTLFVAAFLRTVGLVSPQLPRAGTGSQESGYFE